MTSPYAWGLRRALSVMKGGAGYWKLNRGYAGTVENETEALYE